MGGPRLVDGQETQDGDSGKPAGNSPHGAGGTGGDGRGQIVNHMWRGSPGTAGLSAQSGSGGGGGGAGSGGQSSTIFLDDLTPTSGGAGGGGGGGGRGGTGGGRGGGGGGSIGIFLSASSPAISYNVIGTLGGGTGGAGGVGGRGGNGGRRGFGAPKTYLFPSVNLGSGGNGGNGGVGGSGGGGGGGGGGVSCTYSAGDRRQRRRAASAPSLVPVVWEEPAEMVGECPAPMARTERRAQARRARVRMIPRLRASS
jgi:hypothetical protein